MVASAVDLYSEIGKLKDEIARLKQEAIKVPTLESDLKKQLGEAKFFKGDAEKQKRQATMLEKELKMEKEAKLKMKNVLDESRKKQLELEKIVARLKNDAKFDQKAREGQVKRARIIEHNLTEVTHDNFLQSKLRKEAENRSSVMNIQLQRERSLRLQDIHTKNKVLIAKRQSEKNEKIAEFHRFKEVSTASSLESVVSGLEATVRSQDMIIKTNDVELNASLQEIEAVKLESQRLKRELIEKDDDILHHAEVRAHLENECHRLQTELMVSATTNTERSRPLSTASSGRGMPSLSHERAMMGRTRPETTSEARIRRRKDELDRQRRRTAGAASGRSWVGGGGTGDGGGRDFSFSRVFTTTDGKVATTGSRGGMGSGRGKDDLFNSRGGGRDGGGLRGGGSAGIGGTVTLDEAFIIPIQAPNLDGENMRARTASSELLGHQGIYANRDGISRGESRRKPGTASVRFGTDRELGPGNSVTSTGQRLPSAMKKKRGIGGEAGGTGSQGSNEFDLTNGTVDDSLTLTAGSSDEFATINNNNNNNSGNFQFDQNGIGTPSKRRPKSKTLNVPGSLFLGSGLGLKK